MVAASLTVIYLTRETNFACNRTTFRIIFFLLTANEVLKRDINNFQIPDVAFKGSLKYITVF